MISWLSGSLIKNLVLAGIVIGAAATVYTMYHSAVKLEVENSTLQAEVEKSHREINAIGKQSTLQAKRVVVLNDKLRSVKQTLALAETQILDRNFAEEIKNDPEGATKALQKEINALFTEIETIANATDY